MSESLPPEFFNLADKFIELANGAVSKHGLPIVSGAFTFAAARFNGHAAVAMQPAAGAERDEVVALLVEQYRGLLEANIQEASSAKAR